MKVEDCPKYDTCSAPMCPLSNPEKVIWYADEEICKNREFFDLIWIKNQKKYSKKVKDYSKYFNFKMLKQNCKVTKGIIGLDPNKEEYSQLKKWLAQHPVKKELSKIEKEKVAQRFKKARENLKK